MPQTRYRTSREWLRAVLRRALAVGPVPRYGTPEHLALEPSDPRFVAAVALAAECWRETVDPAEIRLRMQLEIEAARVVDDEERQRVVRGMRDVPTVDELAARRGERAPVPRPWPAADEADALHELGRERDHR